MIILSPAVSKHFQNAFSDNTHDTIGSVSFVRSHNSVCGVSSCQSMFRSSHSLQQRVLISRSVLAPHHCLLGILMCHHVRLPFQT